MTIGQASTEPTTTTSTQSRSEPGRGRIAQRVLVGLEFVTGAAAVVGGVLLAVRPDGSLLQADLAALEGSPFTDWRLPGLLLATLVGGGYVFTAIWQWRRGPGARALSVLAGLCLIAFELFELAWIGFQPLEAVFALVGLTVCGLALSTTGSGG